MTMKQALGTPGFGPTHDMTEVMANPGQLAHRRAIFAGQDIDRNEVYEGYGSKIDRPCASIWREASIALPDAGVIHGCAIR